MLTTHQKGNIAEHAVVYQATKLGIDVYRPVGEGGRCAMLFYLEGGFVRVQCKWASVYRDVIVVRCYSARRNRDGLVRRVYALEEIDAFAASARKPNAAISCRTITSEGGRRSS
jgi:hypothetical protein